jgi:PRTRC genetic system protein A
VAARRPKEDLLKFLKYFTNNMKMNLKVLPFVRKFVEHKIASADSEAITAVMFEYLMAGNGLFIRAKRREFSVCLPVCHEPIKGLPEVKSEIVWHKPKIPSVIWRQILENARSGSDSIQFREDVYVVFWHEAIGEWRWRNIGKERSWARTIADDTLSEYGEAAIELHTHPNGAIHFSRADDDDESGKFRIFGILTDVHEPLPKIRFRCGVYDYFAQIPADYISEMPFGIIDLNKVEQTIRKILQ